MGPELKHGIRQPSGTNQAIDWGITIGLLAVIAFLLQRIWNLVFSDTLRWRTLFFSLLGVVAADEISRTPAARTILSNLLDNPSSASAYLDDIPPNYTGGSFRM